MRWSWRLTYMSDVELAGEIHHGHEGLAALLAGGWQAASADWAEASWPPPSPLDAAQWAAPPSRRRGRNVAWLRQLRDGPFLVKGITRLDDAKRAVDAGASAVSMSNHGGNDLDGTRATIRVLPAVAAAVGGQVEVLLDGRIRRGEHMVKAVALAARAVMIGRAYLWGLAANGQAGVENVLDILRGGIDSALLGLGQGQHRRLDPEDVVVPPGFTRTLGGAGPVAAVRPGAGRCRAHLDRARRGAHHEGHPLPPGPVAPCGINEL